MRSWAIIAATTAAVFMTMDFTWLSLATSRLYRPALAPLLAERPDLTAALLFYTLYIFGILALAIRPASSGRQAGGLGATLGVVAYGTYDLTNLATLRGWPIGLSIIDLVWGMFVTGTAAAAGYWASQRVRALH